METMDDKYGDGSDHPSCPLCGLCVVCGDCAMFGCGDKSSSPQPETDEQNKGSIEG
jgi:hypothetical protein